MDPSSVDAGRRAYHGGADDPDVIDFSANVNPVQPDGIETVYKEAFAAATRYADDTYAAFREAAARHVDATVDPTAVVPTAGGLAGLRLAIASSVETGDTGLVPAPGFSEYARELRLQGAEPSFVAHDTLPETDPRGHAVAIVCTPNNPTGTGYDPDSLRAFADRCRAHDTVLILDEAFLGFTDRPSLAGEPGTVIVRSLTKLFGLPGLRAGFVVATGALGDRLETARLAWNLGTPAARVGRRCLEDRTFVNATRERVRTERARLRNALKQDYAIQPSDAPFLLLDVGDRSVDRLLTTAREAGLALRDARTFRGLDNHVRVAVRRRSANDRLIEVLKDG